MVNSLFSHSRRLLLVLLLLGFPLIPALAAGAFLTELEDLPLAPGLSEIPGGMLFDSPTGRIVEASAQGEIPADQVVAFYTQTLPNSAGKRSAPTAIVATMNCSRSKWRSSAGPCWFGSRWSRNDRRPLTEP